MSRTPTPKLLRFDLTDEQTERVRATNPGGDKLALVFGRAGHGRLAVARFLHLPYYGHVSSTFKTKVHFYAGFS